MEADYRKLTGQLLDVIGKQENVINLMNQSINSMAKVIDDQGLYAMVAAANKARSENNEAVTEIMLLGREFLERTK